MTLPIVTLITQLTVLEAVKLSESDTAFVQGMILRLDSDDTMSVEAADFERVNAIHTEYLRTKS